MYPKNKYWKPLVNYLKKKGLEDEIFIGPEVLLYDFPKVFPYQILKDIDLADYDFDYVVFHKKLPDDMTNEFLDMLRHQYTPVWGNHLFVVFKKNPSRKEKLLAKKYFLHTGIKWNKYYKDESGKRTGILITTYNRPAMLERLLEQLKGRPEEILVVNDGSDESFSEHYARIKARFPQVNFIDNPKNMGLVFSVNTGFSYFLADPDVEWVHYFQDDIRIIDPAFFDKTARLAHAVKRPVVTGIYLPPHKVFAKEEFHGLPVYLLRSTGAWHFLAHRRYLMKNMPIPNPYVGAPKHDRGRPGQGSDEDWWLFSWSPNSIVKRGGYVICIPGLCETDMSAELSTWDFDRQ